jgi:hypothetical protein
MWCSSISTTTPLDITVSAPSGTVTTEAGGAVTFTVQLDSEPLANVTINLSSSDATEGSVSPASLVFHISQLEHTTNGHCDWPE